MAPLAATNSFSINNLHRATGDERLVRNQETVLIGAAAPPAV